MDGGGRHLSQNKVLRDQMIPQLTPSTAAGKITSNWTPNNNLDCFLFGKL